MRAALPLVAVLLAGGCDSVFGLRHVGVQDAADAPIDAPIEMGWKAIAAGYGHSCGIKADDTLWCWGSNGNGEVGTGDAAGIILAPARIGMTEFSSVSSTYLHTCAIGRDDHSLWCWGYNYWGNLGIGSQDNQPTPQRLDGTWKQVSTGAYHTCAIADDDTLWCWGDNTYGEIGTGLMMQAPVPVQLGTDKWLDVDAGYYHSCAIQMDHSLWCWGNNGSGQYGDGTSATSATPKLVTGEAWTDIAAGFNTTCGRAMSGALRCWGAGGRGQTGSGTTGVFYTPQVVKVNDVEAEDWVQVSLDDTHACGVRSDGSLWCWGVNQHGELAIDASPYSATPVQVLGGASAWRRVDGGNDHTCAIDIDNHAWCWGADGRNQLGDGGSAKRVPTLMPGTFKLIAAGTFTTCAIDATGAAFCSGDNDGGQLGDGTTQDRKEMVRVTAPATGWTSIGPGYQHSCGIANGGCYCWGANTYGQIGDGTMTDRLTPTLVGAGQTMVAWDQSCTNATGYVYCWGHNNQGQVGTGSNTNQLTPALVVSTGNVAQLTASYQHTCAVQNTGGALCWGRNYEGEIGNGTATAVTVPTAVTTTNSGSLARISAGSYHTCAVGTDGRLWCWGGNFTGQLGQGDRLIRSSPTRVGMALWKAVATGDTHTCGIQSDGSLWCWGGNSLGQLGINSFLSRYVPGRVGNDTDWVDVFAGHDHTCATKAGGVYYCWGSNDFGQLPDGTAWRTTPVMLP